MDSHIIKRRSGKPLGVVVSRDVAASIENKESLVFDRIRFADISSEARLIEVRLERARLRLTRLRSRLLREQQ